MTNSKATKKALFMSMLSLLLCFTMLMGATFAWFTDTVTSNNNIIKSGNLDVEMYWLDGDEDPTGENWADASAGAIFDYELWEPGYVQARHLKIVNVGSLSLKYQLRILADGVVSKLANVIDVYYAPNATQLTRESISNPQTPVKKLGTLSEVLNNTNANALTKLFDDNSRLDPNNERTLTLAFKMQESAGNEYQNLSIGSEFRVELLATQVEAEKDSFDEFYDQEADFAPQETPSAMVTELSGSELNINATAGIGGTAEAIELDAGYKFEPTETPEQGAASKNAKYHVDFVVYADQKVPANSLALAGYYDAWCKYNNDNWVAMMADTDIPADTEIRLVEALGATVNYEEICNYGNDGIGFQCGIAELIDGANSGTTITVELRMYETEEPSDSNNNSTNVETGEYTILGKFTYTFDNEVVEVSNAAQLAEAAIVGPLEEDFMYPAGTSAVMYKNIAMTGEAQINHNTNDVLALYKVTANLDHDVIIRNSGAAICISDCDFTLAPGAKLISLGESGSANQVFLINVTVNGELLTQENAGQYLDENIGWVGVYPEWPQTN